MRCPRFTLLFFLLSACAMMAPASIAQVPVRDSIAILAFDASGQTGGIVIGYHHEATAGYDPVFGDKPIPPVPAVEAFDFRFLDPPGLRRMPPTGCYRDIRSPASTGVADTFRVRVQPQNGSFPVRIGWKNAQLRSFSSARLHYTDARGQTIFDMKSSERVELTADTTPDFLIILTR